MKKILYVLAIVAFAACNNDASTTEEKKDSTANVIDSTADAKRDSVENTSDSVKAKIDSTAEAKKDSLKK